MRVNVLMVGVHRETLGGMWTVAESYINNVELNKRYQICYIPTAYAGPVFKRVLLSAVAYVRIFFVLLLGQIQFVHIHMASKGSFYRKSYVVRMAKLFRKKVIIHLHGAGFAGFYERSPQKKKEYIRRIILKTDRMICLGDYWKKQIGLISGMSDAENNIKTIVLNNAVPVPADNNYNINANEFMFLGEIGKRKGIFDIVQAVKKIDSLLPKEIIFAVYGKGETEKLQQMIAEYGLAGRIEVRGFLLKEDRAHAFSKIMVNILPSYNEGLPMTILEGMAEGIPTISTDVGSICEVVRDEENGIIVTPGDIDEIADAILRLVNDTQLRALYSKKCFELMKEKFSLESHIKCLQGIYADVLSQETEFKRLNNDEFGT